MEKPLVLKLRQAADEHNRRVREIIADATPKRGRALAIYPSDSMRQAETVLIKAAMKLYGDDKTLTALSLGISIKTLYNRLNEYAAAERERAAQPIPAA